MRKLTKVVDLARETEGFQTSQYIVNDFNEAFLTKNDGLARQTRIKLQTELRWFYKNTGFSGELQGLEADLLAKAEGAVKAYQEFAKINFLVEDLGEFHKKTKSYLKLVVRDAQNKREVNRRAAKLKAVVERSERREAVLNFIRYGGFVQIHDSTY